MTGLTYRDAGVDIDAGESVVEAIKPLARATKRSGADAALGGFGGVFDPRAAGFEDPLLVSGTDSVGTKLKLAIDVGVHDTVGIDCVAMCANDVLVQGAEPLFFLDYIGIGQMEVDLARDLVAGVAEGCQQAGCALIGGESAELPGLYAPGDYDLVGFCCGAVERDGLLPRDDLAAGDVILGLASSGVHSNGFSLVRKAVALRGLDLADDAPFQPGTSLGLALLEPTRIYVRGCLAAIKAGGVKALCHITGGGLIENIPRVLPDHLGAQITAGSWQVPGVFSWLATDYQGSGITAHEMARTFNCGIGMIVIAAPGDAEAVAASLRDGGETVWPIGELVARDAAGPLTIDNLDSDWLKG